MAKIVKTKIKFANLSSKKKNKKGTKTCPTCGGSGKVKA